jgi:flavin reductase (DIM6/NTAB) family NADH-FMN oxidoreductase RutF
VPAADRSDPLDPAAYRHVMSRCATGVTVVATVHEGIRYGMTVNSFTSVSLKPLLALFCCEHDASLHDPVLATGSWGVSVLTADQSETSQWFATRGIAGVDQMRDRPCRSGPVTGAPLLEGALAWFECRNWQTYDGGDHTIVVGEVVAASVAADHAPLLYFRGNYTTAEDGLP